MKILVVDDERAVRESLRRALELEGYDVQLAEDGAQAIEQLGGNNGQPDFFAAMQAGKVASVWMPQWYMTRFPDNEMSSIVCLCKFMNGPLGQHGAG